MVSTKIGDIFKSKAQTLVNTVNCVGVMGKGIALGFKKQFPDMHDDYVARCKGGHMKLGEPYLYRRSPPPWILNFPTKDHWRSVSRLSDIVRGLEYLLQHYKEWGITSLAVPPLGCGQGQLEWKVVGPTLYRYLSRLDVPVEMYAPHGTPEQQIRISFLAQEAKHLADLVGKPQTSKIDPAWVALVQILDRIYHEPYHWPVGRTSLQKLAYFATEAGLPTGLHFSRGSYGPYASALKPIVTKLVNNGLLEEKKLGRMFAVAPGPTYRDAAKTFQGELEKWDQIIERVSDLLLRMRTEQAEAAATAHFAAQTLERMGQKEPSETDVLAEVKRWKQRRRPALEDPQAASAIRNLNLLGWINVRPAEELPVPEESGADA